jgi:hypothetical protein
MVSGRPGQKLALRYQGKLTIVTLDQTGAFSGNGTFLGAPA